jgi:hypothetical protein
MFRPIIFIVLLVLFNTATAQQPVPKVNGSCPYGYRSTGDYCKPFDHSNTKNDPVIVKNGNSCPAGYRTSGGYCKRFHNSEAVAIPRADGAKCPRGWNTKENYCEKPWNLRRTR